MEDVSVFDASGDRNSGARGGLEHELLRRLERSLVEAVPLRILHCRPTHMPFRSISRRTTTVTTAAT